MADMLSINTDSFFAFHVEIKLESICQLKHYSQSTVEVNLVKRYIVNSDTEEN